MAEKGGLTFRSPTMIGRCCKISTSPTGSKSGTGGQLRGVLEPLAAHYFLKARTPKGRLIDSVARFHLGNGARLERIDWLGDLSPKGLRESARLMVNYLYRLEDIEKNHEAYANQDEIAASSAVKKLLKTKAGGCWTCGCLENLSEDRFISSWPGSSRPSMSFVPTPPRTQTRDSSGMTSSLALASTDAERLRTACPENTARPGRGP